MFNKVKLNLYTILKAKNQRLKFSNIHKICLSEFSYNNNDDHNLKLQNVPNDDKKSKNSLEKKLKETKLDKRGMKFVEEDTDLFNQKKIKEEMQEHTGMKLLFNAL